MLSNDLQSDITLERLQIFSTEIASLPMQKISSDSFFTRKELDRNSSTYAKVTKLQRRLLRYQYRKNQRQLLSFHFEFKIFCSQLNTSLVFCNFTYFSDFWKKRFDKTIILHHILFFDCHPGFFSPSFHRKGT